MFCNHCGQKLEDNTKFCSNCGQPVVAPATPVTPVTPVTPAPEPKKERYVKVKGKVNWKVFIIMMVIGALILGIGGFVIVNLLNGDGPFGDLLGGTTSSRRDDDEDDDDDDDRDKDNVEDEDRDADEDRDDPYEGQVETTAPIATEAPDAAVSDSYIYYEMDDFTFYVFDYLNLEELYYGDESVELEGDNVAVEAVVWDMDDYEAYGIYNSMDMLEYMADSAEDSGMDTRFDERAGQTYLTAYGDDYAIVISFYEYEGYYYAVQVMLFEEAVDEYMYEAVEIVACGYFD